MFDFMSRYYSLETLKHVVPDGREISYKRRRFLPQGETLALLTEVKVTQGERLDLIASRTLGAGEQFWQLCDANNAMNPFALTEGDDAVGRTLRIPMPQTPQS